MNKIIERGILYDFYGELLTEHQREIYEDAVYNDLSLNEIAEEKGISKQGVHDLISRCTRTMEGYEVKLHLIEKNEKMKKTLEQLRSLEASEEMQSGDTAQVRQQIRNIADQIAEEIS